MKIIPSVPCKSFLIVKSQENSVAFISIGQFANSQNDSFMQYPLVYLPVIPQ